MTKKEKLQETYALRKSWNLKCVKAWVHEDDMEAFYKWELEQHKKRGLTVYDSPRGTKNVPPVARAKKVDPKVKLKAKLEQIQPKKPGKNLDILDLI